MNLFAPVFGKPKYAQCRSCGHEVSVDAADLERHARGHTSDGTAKVSKVAKRANHHRKLSRGARAPSRPIAWELLGNGVVS